MIMCRYPKNGRPNSAYISQWQACSERGTSLELVLYCAQHMVYMAFVATARYPVLIYIHTNYIVPTPLTVIT
jgi:hypothetical protein